MTEPSPTASTPVRRKPSAAPAQILEATEALLLSDGIAGVSIRRVSERSGYSAPTIYHHFGDKRGLIAALLEARFRVVRDLMALIPRGSDPAQYLREIVTSFVSFAFEHPDHYRLLTAPLDVEPEVPSADAAQELVRGALEELAREGTLATPDVEAAYQVLWAVSHGLISIQLNRPGFEFSESLAQLTFDMVETGLLRRRNPK